MNLESIGFAWEKGAVARKYCSRFYPISTINKEDILEICREEKIDGVLTIATDIAVPTINYVAENMSLVGNSFRSTQLSTNKYLMRQAFIQHGMRCPKFFKADRIEEIYLQQELLNFPLIIKPVDRSGSKGVTKVYDIENLTIAVENGLKESFCKQVIIEEFIEGEEVSVESISFEGVHYILAITDKVTSGEPHFVELEHHQPSQLPINIQEQIILLTEQALDSLEFKYGASHSEFLISKNGIFITEVGCRMGGDFIGSDLVYLSTGYDFLKATIEVCFGKFDLPVKQFQKHSGVYFYSEFSERIGNIIRNKDFKEFCIRSEITNNSLMPLTESSLRSGYFIYHSDNRLIL